LIKQVASRPEHLWEESLASDAKA